MTDLYPEKYPEKRENELNLALLLMHFGFRKMIEEPDRLLSRRGFGRVHHRVLFFVARRPGMSIGDLLSTLDVTKQSLHRPMLDLVRAGLLEARLDPQSRRIKRLYLTRGGQRFEDQLSGIQRKLFGRVFGRQGRAAEVGFRSVLHDLGEGRAAAVLGGDLVGGRALRGAGKAPLSLETPRKSAARLARRGAALRRPR
jgi:DNA-binding MarR family transcriptional regulator